MQEASFGERLHEKRLLMNLSLAELAHNLNDWLAINEPNSKLVFSKSMISRWENGKADPQLSYVDVVDKYFMELGAEKVKETILMAQEMTSKTQGIEDETEVVNKIIDLLTQKGFTLNNFDAVIARVKSYYENNATI